MEEDKRLEDLVKFFKLIKECGNNLGPSVDRVMVFMGDEDTYLTPSLKREFSRHMINHSECMKGFLQEIDIQIEDRRRMLKC